MKIEKFFKEDFVTFSMYEVARKIPSVIDGLRISERKSLHTVLKNNITSLMKVEQLAAKVADETQYLHGVMSLNGVITGMGASYVGASNYPLLKGDGNFGTRFIKQASAPRYINASKTELSDYIFRKEDYPVLIEQTFEGKKIEPKFFVPIIPILLVNGTIALSTGYAAKILPRNIEKIIDFTKKYIKNNKTKLSLLPEWKGYSGNITQDAVNKNKFYIYGHLIRNKNTLIIDEIPVKYCLESYINFLETLGEKEGFSFVDMSTDDKFKFEIKLPTKYKEYTNEQLYSVFGLIEIENENLTGLDSAGKVCVFDSVMDIFIEYAKTRELFYNKRKTYQLNLLTNIIRDLEIKARFIKAVVSKKIDITAKEQVIQEALLKLGFTKINDSFDYLLSLKLNVLTKEKVSALEDKIQEYVTTKTVLEKTSPLMIWEKELDELKAKIIEIEKKKGK